MSCERCKCEKDLHQRDVVDRLAAVLRGANEVLRQAAAAGVDVEIYSDRLQFFGKEVQQTRIEYVAVATLKDTRNGF